MAVTDFDGFAEGLQQAPDLDLGDIPVPERELLIEEAKIGCMTGMLLCLSRDQRIAFVLGSIFGLSDTLAAEILDIQPATFRKRLQRARDDLDNFMSGNCGLINKENSCRCRNKARAFQMAGHLDGENFIFQRDHVDSIGKMATQDAGVVYDKVSNDYPALYREHPFTDPQGLKARLAGLLEKTTLDGLL